MRKFVRKSKAGAVKTEIFLKAREMKARAAGVVEDTIDLNTAARQVRERLEPFVPKFEAFRQHKLEEYHNRQAVGMRLGVMILGGMFCILFLIGASACEGGLAACLIDCLAVALVLALTFLMFFAIWMDAPKDEYVRDFKREIMPVVIEAYAPTFRYKCERHKPGRGLFDRGDDFAEAGLLLHSGFFDQFSRLPMTSRDDCIYGNYHGVDFSFMEMSIGMMTNRQSYVFHSGIFFLKFNQKFAGHTLLMRNSDKLKRMIVAGKSKITNQAFERAEMEDTGFEGLFEVYTTDQQEARYILTPLLMERLKHIRLGRSAKFPQIEAAFVGHHAVLFAHYDNDLFEPPDVKEPVTNIDPVINILEEFSLVFSVIDELNMNVFAARRDAAERFANQSASVS